MAGAKSGVLEASGAFWAIAICDASAAKQAMATPKMKCFEVLMMLEVAEALEHKSMVIVPAVWSQK
jgi:hypothetical protein